MKVKRPAELPEPAERRRIREAAGITGFALAAEIGVAPGTVYGWETGREPSGPLRTLYAAALRRLEETP